MKLLSEKRGWILSNDGFMHQLVRLAREEELLDPMPSPRLDAVAEEPHEPHELDEPHNDVGELLWDEVVSFVLIYVLFLVLGFAGTSAGVGVRACTTEVGGVPPNSCA